MRLWALWFGYSGEMELEGLYEAEDDAQREKDALMDEQGRRDRPKSCTVVLMETIPAKVRGGKA